MTANHEDIQINDWKEEFGEDWIKSVQEATLGREDEDPEDTGILEWYSRQQTMLQKEIETLTSQFERRTQRIRRKMEALEYFHGDNVKKLAQHVIMNRKGSKIKYLDTGYGRFSLRDSKPTIKIEDGAKFLDAVERELGKEARDSMIKVEERVIVSSVKARIKYDGNVFIDSSTGEIVKMGVLKRLGITAVPAESKILFSAGKSQEE